MQTRNVKVALRDGEMGAYLALPDRTPAGAVMAPIVGSASLEEAYAKIEDGELWLIGSDIPEYAKGNVFNHKPKRPRKLLVHRREISKFAGKASQQGYTLIPLRMYFKQGRAKVELAVARGKQQHDKRQDQKTADAQREIRRAMTDRKR